MYDPDLPRPLTADVARIELQHDFPRVPERVVTAVLDAYCRVTPSLSTAVRASRARLADACVAT